MPSSQVNWQRGADPRGADPGQGTVQLELTTFAPMPGTPRAVWPFMCSLAFWSRGCMFLGVDESQEYVRSSAFYCAGLAEGRSHDTLLDKGPERWMEMGRWRWIEMEEERKAQLQGKSSEISCSCLGRRNGQAFEVVSISASTRVAGWHGVFFQHVPPTLDKKWECKDACAGMRHGKKSD